MLEPNTDLMDRDAYEGAIGDASADLALLELVLHTIEGAADGMRQPGTVSRGTLMVPIGETTLTALARARINMRESVRGLERLFHGEAQL